VGHTPGCWTSPPPPLRRRKCESESSSFAGYRLHTNTYKGVSKVRGDFSEILFWKMRPPGFSKNNTLPILN